MRRLDEINQLEQSKFGRPKPRHGLKLLYWFANDCLILDQNNSLQLCCYPKNGDFGFHIFENRYEVNGGRLLPDVTFTYYVVGNLSKAGAYNMPHYVREHHTGYRDNSNKDRIIISINNRWFDKVYVTEHSDRSNFNKYATFCISRRLIKIIRQLTLQDFLVSTGYSKPQSNIYSTTPIYLNNQQALRPAPSTISNNIPPVTMSKVRDTCIEIEPPFRSSRNQDTDIEMQRPERSRAKRSCCTIL